MIAIQDLRAMAEKLRESGFNGPYVVKMGEAAWKCVAREVSLPGSERTKRLRKKRKAMREKFVGQIVSKDA